jgi:hypothetical protein
MPEFESQVLVTKGIEDISICPKRQRYLIGTIASFVYSIGGLVLVTKNAEIVLERYHGIDSFLCIQFKGQVLVTKYQRLCE